MCLVLLDWSEGLLSALCVAGSNLGLCVAGSNLGLCVAGSNPSLCVAGSNLGLCVWQALILGIMCGRL
jgi:hypothetical protein